MRYRKDSMPNAETRKDSGIIRGQRGEGPDHKGI